VVGVLATAFTIWLAFRGDIAEQIDAWLVSLIMWISPWAAIMFVHFWILERGRVEVDGLYDPPYRSRVGDVRWVAVGSFLAGVVAAWLFQYGLVSVFQGPLSKALNNVDLSWLSGMTVAAGSPGRSSGGAAGGRGRSCPSRPPSPRRSGYDDARRAQRRPPGGRGAGGRGRRGRDHHGDPAGIVRGRSTAGRRDGDRRGGRPARAALRRAPHPPRRRS
jgi:hypothetical protein